MAKSFFKNDGKVVMEYLYDFSVDGGIATQLTLSDKHGKGPLPVGMIVTDCMAAVLTSVTSGGSATVEWGNGDDSDGYSGTAIAKATLVAGYCVNGMGIQAAAPGALLWDNTNDAQIPLYIDDATTGAFKIIANVAALTAGKIVFMVEGLNPSVTA
jgi:hypothetical protein